MAWNGNNKYSNRNSNYKRANTDKGNVKKSGATYTKIKKGKNEGLYAVNAWRKTRNGLMIAKAFPAGGDEVIESQRGNEFVRYAVEISVPNVGTSQTYWALMNKKTRLIPIKELGLVISPNGNGITGSGVRVTGYFGKIR